MFADVFIVVHADDGKFLRDVDVLETRRGHHVRRRHVVRRKNGAGPFERGKKSAKFNLPLRLIQMS